jgi:hypothetical protein
MQLGQNDYQLLGLMELNGQELCDIVGKQYGKSPTYIKLKYLTDFYNSDIVNLPWRLSQSSPPNERGGHRERSRIYLWIGPTKDAIK